MKSFTRGPIESGLTAVWFQPSFEVKNNRSSVFQQRARTEQGEEDWGTKEEEIERQISATLSAPQFSVFLAWEFTVGQFGITNFPDDLPMTLN